VVSSGAVRCCTTTNRTYLDLHATVTSCPHRYEVLAVSKQSKPDNQPSKTTCANAFRSPVRGLGGIQAVQQGGPHSTSHCHSEPGRPELMLQLATATKISNLTGTRLWLCPGSPAGLPAAAPPIRTKKTKQPKTATLANKFRSPVRGLCCVQAVQQGCPPLHHHLPAAPGRRFGSLHCMDAPLDGCNTFMHPSAAPCHWFWSLLAIGVCASCQWLRSLGHTYHPCRHSLHTHCCKHVSPAPSFKLTCRLRAAAAASAAACCSSSASKPKGSASTSAAAAAAGAACCACWAAPNASASRASYASRTGSAAPADACMGGGGLG